MTIKNTLRPGRLLALIACALSVVSGSAATFHTVPLIWNAPPEFGIHTYKVYVGSASQQYTQVIEAGTNLSLSVANMEFGRTYYFAVTAGGGTRLESFLSPELAVEIVQPPLPVGSGISVTGSGQAALNWSYPVSAYSTSLRFIVESSTDLLHWTEAATVLPTASTGGNSQTAQFLWPSAMTGTRNFYRLTAKNWMEIHTTL